MRGQIDLNRPIQQKVILRQKYLVFPIFARTLTKGPRTQRKQRQKRSGGKVRISHFLTIASTKWDIRMLLVNIRTLSN